jgi:hypothetical protein
MPGPGLGRTYKGTLLKKCSVLGVSSHYSRLFIFECSYGFLRAKLHARPTFLMSDGKHGSDIQNFPVCIFSNRTILSFSECVIFTNKKVALIYILLRHIYALVICQYKIGHHG